MQLLLRYRSFKIMSTPKQHNGKHTVRILVRVEYHNIPQWRYWHWFKNKCFLTSEFRLCLIKGPLESIFAKFKKQFRMKVIVLSINLSKDFIANNQYAHVITSLRVSWTGVWYSFLWQKQNSEKFEVFPIHPNTKYPHNCHFECAS